MRPHSIEVGDSVLIKRQTTKSKSCYDPEPYRVTGVNGSQITGKRGDTVRVRDAQKFKKVRIQPSRQYRRQREPTVVHEADNEYFSYNKSRENYTAATSANHSLVSTAENIQNNVDLNGQREPVALQRSQRT